MKNLILISICTILLFSFSSNTTFNKTSSNLLNHSLESDGVSDMLINELVDEIQYDLEHTIIPVFEDLETESQISQRELKFISDNFKNSDILAELNKLFKEREISESQVFNYLQKSLNKGEMKQLTTNESSIIYNNSTSAINCVQASIIATTSICLYRQDPSAINIFRMIAALAVQDAACSEQN